MRFLKRDDAAGFKGHDVDMGVMAQVLGVDETRRAPAVAGVGLSRRVGLQT